MSDEEREAVDYELEEVAAESTPSEEGLSLYDLRNVRLKVIGTLGSASLMVREVLELEKGSIITLDTLAGEMTELYVNDRILGRGEVVVINDTLHVRVGEIQGIEGAYDVE